MIKKVSSKTKISVIGLGYIGSSLSLLLSQKFNVIGFDIDLEKAIKLGNQDFSSLDDPMIEEVARSNNFNFRVSSNLEDVFKSDIIILCLPTDWNEKDKTLNTDVIEDFVDQIALANTESLIILKSTLPIGLTSKLAMRYPDLSICYSPEFLQEGRSIIDNLYPSRIIVGGDNQAAMEVTAGLMASFSLHENNNILFMSSSEAEATKLFSNMYLSMRVAFFNELDTFAMHKGLDTKSIIDGVCADNRIGNFYNNPSFGFGGYCLPKDSFQLEASFTGIPQSLISGTIQANNSRKLEIIHQVKDRGVNNVGIYCLENKFQSGNYRHSVMIDLIDMLVDEGIVVLIYEESLHEETFKNCIVMRDFLQFKKDSELILTNRFQPLLSDVTDKVFTRDIFNRN